ncbi:MAG: TetR/AcrR family transcriptional regulator [Saprospiraceae bacterium]|nr:TetR/AcrR family transcriptional regulator [Saprospiraceae bacterium]
MKIKDKAKEERIKQVTLELVAQEGLAGMKISKVAKQAGLSPSMIYTYFKNKEELIESVFWDVVKGIFDSVENQPATNVPFKLQFRQQFHRFMALKLEKSIEFEYFSSFVKSPFFKPEYHKMLIENSRGMLDLIREGRRKMIIKDDVPVDLILALGGGFMEKLVEFHQKRVMIMDKETIDQAFELLWDGVKQ